MPWLSASVPVGDRCGQSWKDGGRDAQQEAIKYAEADELSDSARKDIDRSFDARHESREQEILVLL